MIYPYILIGVALYFVFRGYGDNYLKAANDTKYHKLSFIKDAFIIGLLCFAWFKDLSDINMWLMWLHFGMIASLVLNITMAYHLGKSIWYLGNTAKTDKIIKKYIGEVLFFAIICVINLNAIFYFLKLGI